MKQRKFFSFALSLLLIFTQRASAAPFKLAEVNLGSTNVDARRVDVLVEAVNACYPEPSYIDRTGGRVDAVARIGRRFGDSSSMTISDSTSNYIGIQATLPLWSPQDVERDRTRELTRRREIASAVGKYLGSVGKMAGNRSAVEILSQVEKWEAVRVEQGVSQTDAQVQAIKAVMTERRTELEGVADYHAARAELLAFCPRAARGAVETAMRGLEP